MDCICLKPSRWTKLKTKGMKMKNKEFTFITNTTMHPHILSPSLPCKTPSLQPHAHSTSSFQISTINKEPFINHLHFNHSTTFTHHPFTFVPWLPLLSNIIHRHFRLHSHSLIQHNHALHMHFQPNHSPTQSAITHHKQVTCIHQHI